MSIKVKIEDNTIHNVPITLKVLSPLFKEENDMLLLNCRLEVLKKLSDFADYYPNLKRQQQKLFESPELIRDKDEEISKWCDEFAKIDKIVLIELMKLCHDLNIKPLLDLCCYNISVIIGESSIEKINELFGIKCDFTPDEKKELDDETGWIDE